MNNMKYLPLLLSLCISPYIFAQSVQHGRVFEQNSGYTPLPGVQFDIKDAAPEISDPKGYFHLEFSTKAKGQILFVNSIYKDDYLVINQKVIDQWSFAPETELKVIMSLKSKFEQNLREYYRIGYQNYKKRYDSILLKLKAEKENKALNEIKYKKSLDSISNAYKGELETLDYYVDIFARINKDDLDGIDRIAIRLVDEGKLDSAIVVYEKERFHEKFINQYKTVGALNAEINAMIPSMQHYADMCAFAGGKENYEKVDKILGLIASSDTTNYNYGLNYYNFLLQQKQYKKAIVWGERIQNLCKNEDEKANIIGTLSICYINVLDLKKGQYYLQKSQGVIETAMKDSDEKKLQRWGEYLLPMMALYNEFLSMKDTTILDVITKKYLNFIMETKKFQKLFSKSDWDLNFLYNGAYTFVIPSLLNSGNIVEAQKCYEILTQLYKNLNYSSQNKIQEENKLLGDVMNAEIHFAEGKKTLAKTYLEALDSRFQKLYKKNPAANTIIYLQYICYWAECLYNLNDLDGTLNKVNEGLDILKNIDLEEQGTSLSNSLNKLFHVSKNVYSRRDMPEKQERLYEKMHSFYGLFNFIPTLKDAMIEDEEWCGFISDYSDIEVRLNKPDKAKTLIIKSLDILGEESQNEKINNNRMWLYRKLGNIYHSMGNDSACIYYEKSKSLCDDLMEFDRNKYLRYKIINVNDLGTFYRDVKSNNTSALEHFMESLALSKLNNSSDSIYLIGNAEMELGITYSCLENLNKRDEHYRKAIAYNKSGLALRKKNLESNHPDIAVSCEIIGNLYMWLEEYNNARDYYKQALQIYTAFFKGDHVSIIIMDNVIGDTYLHTEEYDKALDYFLDALKLATHYFPKGHLGTAQLYNNMSKAYYGQGDFGKALECYEHIIQIFVNQEQRISFDVANTYYNIATIYSIQKDYSKALINCQKAKEIFEMLCNEDPQINTNLSQVLGDISYYSILKQKFSEAVQYAEQAMKLDSSQTWIKSNLMMALFFAEKYKEAEKVYDEMKDIMINGQSFKEILSEDIKVYENAKVIPQSVLQELEELKVRLKQ